MLSANRHVLINRIILFQDFSSVRRRPGRQTEQPSRTINVQIERTDSKSDSHKSTEFDCQKREYLPLKGYPRLGGNE